MKLAPGAVITKPGSSERYDTGSWRYTRPIYEDKTPACNDKCPAGEKVQKYIDLINRGRFKEALETIREDNPFPAVCGRVCYHPCEEACSRDEYDESLGIHHLERFLGDYGISKGYASGAGKKLTPRSSAKIAVVGSGPAGLSCAYHLARRGYQVTVFEALPVVGGMLAIGIPSYRLPKDVLRHEISFIQALDINFKTNACISSLDELKDYQAIFLAVGASMSIKLGISREDAVGVHHGIDLLRALNLGEKVEIGKKVVVVGGGNTAIDCARSSLRLGASVTVIYRRSREEMPATPEEIEGALAEGAEIMYLTAPNAVIVTDGKAAGLECIKMRLGEPDASGRRRPIPIEGSEFKLGADMVIVAIGQIPDLSFLPNDVEQQKGRIVVDENGQTSRPGIFAGGDAAGAPERVADAIGSGKRAALAIDCYLRGKAAPAEKKPEVVPFEELNLEYFVPAPRVAMPYLAPKDRAKDFREINLGYTQEMASTEAERCFSCGVCNGCDNCWLFCPDIAVKKLPDSRYEIDYDHCKGCGICATECPRRAIEMVSEGENEASSNRK